MSDPFENRTRSGIKSIQRGTVTGGSGATATISAVNTAKSELRALGFSTSNTDNTASPRIALTNSTTITINSSAGSAAMSWELTEFY